MSPRSAPVRRSLRIRVAGNAIRWLSLVVHQFWLTAIGRDRPGIVARIARVLLDHGLNIEDSQMRILGGRFALILLLRGGPRAEQLGEAPLAAGPPLRPRFISTPPLSHPPPPPPH